MEVDGCRLGGIATGGHKLVARMEAPMAKRVRTFHGELKFTAAR